jgi:hypothetical protein
MNDESKTDNVNVLVRHEARVTSVAIDGEFIVSGTADKTVHVWNRIVSGSWDNTVRVWNTSGGFVVKHDDWVNSVAI